MQVNKQYIYWALAFGGVILFLLSVCFGAVNVPVKEVFSSVEKAFLQSSVRTLNERIIWQIRLPRAVLCFVTGAVLAVGGTLMQGLFRNPIVEPGLVGTSSGAAFGAALYYSLGGMLKIDFGVWTLPIFSFVGAAVSTVLVFALAETRHTNRSSIVRLLLVGIAINALFLSLVGFLAYIARDPQARSISFWNLGTLSGASWQSVYIVGAVGLAGILFSLRFAKRLNALFLGEEDAAYLGVNIKRMRRQVMLINVIIIATATAFTGVISFVGLVTPHLLRVFSGSDNRYLIIGSALLGGILLSAADIAARLLVQPAELPIGIVTSVIGVPVFLFLLRRKEYFF